MNEQQQKTDAAGGPPNVIFALDIGTRSVIGIVGTEEPDGLFRILDFEVLEHSRRAMVDGQIEDIEQVARVAGTVKRTLEERLGFPLARVHIAAAGRALRTVRAEYAMELNAADTITLQTVSSLEAEAVKCAQETLRQEGTQPELDFYCVGYSVVKYYLDDYALSTLLDHKGKTAKVELVATFLPGQVVESLYAVMSKIGLTVASLTLEPIAAINAVIPQELRILNLALVDIGAGTSDIAISRDGSVVAYTMATIAGDEITEAIIKAFLVDFQTAERVKMELLDDQREIRFKNILGFEQTVTTAELFEAIGSSVNGLCREISEKILEVNGGPPAAVFLVGGGSKLPRLAENVSINLNLEDNKVAVGGTNYMKRSILSQQEIDGPEFVTPVGIALTALMRKQNGLQVLLNGKETAVLKSGSATVMDVLLANGFESAQIIGRSGKSITFELNGQKKTVRGGHPVPAEIRVGGVLAGIATPVVAGDAVEITPAVQGRDAAPKVEDVAGPVRGVTVMLNGLPVDCGTCVLLNGEKVPGDREIHDLDLLETTEIHTLNDLMQQANLSFAEVTCLVGGAPANPEHILENGEDIRYFERSSAVQAASGAPADSAPEQAPLAKEAEEVVEYTLSDFVSPGQPAAAQPSEEEPAAARSQARVSFYDEPLWDKPIRVTVNGQPMELEPKVDGAPYQFVDMLNFVDIDPTKPQGNIVLNLNGTSASYLDVVRGGDAIEVFWDGEES